MASLGKQDSGHFAEYERRIRRKDGQFRWFLVQYNPLLDERGEVIRWYATSTDIDDRKQAEERTKQENFALREQIDQVFMFEEIVGCSPALKSVLSSIVKVAPTDSTGGRIEKQAIVELRRLFEFQTDYHDIVLDLKEVGVVDREVMRFL